MELPQIGISYSEDLPANLFDDFIEIIKADKLNIKIESRKNAGPFASLEWLIPPAIVLVISRGYFDAFLREMGKDHYDLLKSGLSILHKKLFGPKAPQIHLLSTAGKIKSDQPYSLLYSIYAEGPSSKPRFKLLFQKDITETDYNTVIESFLDFLYSYHTSSLDQETARRLSQARVISGTILLAFDFKQNQIEFLDPLPENVRAKMNAARKEAIR